MSEWSNVSGVEISAVGEPEHYEPQKPQDRYWSGDVTEKLLNRICPEIFQDEVDVRDLLIDGTRFFIEIS